MVYTVIFKDYFNFLFLIQTINKVILNHIFYLVFNFKKLK